MTRWNITDHHIKLINEYINFNGIPFIIELSLGDNYITEIGATILANNIRVLIYAGDADFICNWMGNKAWTLDLDWNGKTAFNNAVDHDWNVDGKKAGTVRTASNFTFLQVNNAGHMVPMK